MEETSRSCVLLSLGENLIVIDLGLGLTAPLPGRCARERLRAAASTNSATWS